jgi:hypothetical protein
MREVCVRRWLDTETLGAEGAELPPPPPPQAANSTQSPPPASAFGTLRTTVALLPAANQMAVPAGTVAYQCRSCTWQEVADGNERR